MKTDSKLKKTSISGIVATCATILLFCSSCINAEATPASDKIVFLGDSITSSYNLEHYFYNEPVINSGVWGDRTDQALIRLEEAVYAYNPNKVFILLGINDVGYGRTNEDIAVRLQKIISAIQTNCPYAEIYLISVYPLNVSDFDTWYPPMSEDINYVVDDLNNELIILAEKMDIKYIDIASYLKNENNELKKEYTVEGLHLTEEAYEVISTLLEGYID